MKLTRFIKVLALMTLVVISSVNTTAFAQLRKTTVKVEKLKSFSAGQTTLCYLPDTDVYCLKFINGRGAQYGNVLFFIGKGKEQAISNLQDLYSALSEAQKGDSFEFEAAGYRYNLSYHWVAGITCFRVQDIDDYTDDYGLLAKKIINDILKYLNK